MDQVSKPVNINDTRIDVDLCFVCDCTSTMTKEIQQVQKDITNLVATVSNKLKAQLRVAFIAYRDYAKTDIDPEIRIQYYDFTTNLNAFIAFLNNVEANGGGGDRCEDVMGGLKDSLSLSWKSPTKVLFHMFSPNTFNQRFYAQLLSSDVMIHRMAQCIIHSMMRLKKIKKSCKNTWIWIRNHVRFASFTLNSTYASLTRYEHTGREKFGGDSVEYLMIFRNKWGDKRQQALENYIESRKNERDRFPDKHPNDIDHNEILLAMKTKGIQYYIAKKTNNVNKMIDVFKKSALNIKYNVETMELTQCSQLFETVYHSISAAITLSKEIKHTQVIQQRARRLFLDSKMNDKGGHVFQVFCGIDFGTDGTAFSYCLPGDDKVYTPSYVTVRIPIT